MILPGRHTRDPQAAAGTNQRRSAAVSTPTDALRRGPAGWRVEPQAQPVLVDAVDAVGHPSQPMVGPEHPVAAIAELAAAKQQHLGAELVALKQRQDRDPSSGAVQLHQGKVDRGRRRHRHPPRVDHHAADLRLAVGNLDPVAAGEVGGGVRCGQHPALVDERAGAAGNSFFKINVWRGQAEHLADSLGKGDRVMVTGRLRQRSWETSEGDKWSVTEIEAEEVGASLKWATAKVERTSQRGNEEGNAGRERQAERGGDFNDAPPTY